MHVELHDGYYLLLIGRQPCRFFDNLEDLRGYAWLRATAEAFIGHYVNYMETF